MTFNRPSVKRRTAPPDLHSLAAWPLAFIALFLLCVNLRTAHTHWTPLIERTVLSVPRDTAKGVALLVAKGDDATNLQDSLTSLAYAVVRVTPAQFVGCLAADACAALARDAAARAGIVALPPVVVARAAAAEAFGAAARAGDAFHALVSLDHCPTADSVARHDARGESAPWYVFLRAGQACATLADENAHPAVHLSRVAADSDPAPPPEFGALLQWLDPRHAAQGRADASVAGIPLVLSPVAHARRAVVFMSGDGGWAELDRGVARALVGDGIAVIGWDALAYYWQPRSPETLARDLERVLGEFHARWHLERVVLAGYSFGASTLPFAVNRLSPAQRALVEKVVLLGPTPTTAFEFHLAQWLGSDADDSAAVGPEILRLAPLPAWCVHGARDSEARCPALQPPGRSITLPGDHHFDGDYARLARLLAAPPVGDFTP